MLLEEELRKNGYQTLAKVTGHDPMYIWNGSRIPINRDHHLPLLDFDNVPGILDFDCDVLILENQAITPYTMRYIHSLIDPQHILIPNIRIDHTEGLGENLKEMAENFVKNYRVTARQKTVYYGENIDEIFQAVAPVFRDFATRNPRFMKFLEIAPRPQYHGVPYIENLNVVSLFLKHSFDIQIDLHRSLKQMLGTLSIKTSPESIRYLDLAKVNDPASFLQVLQYIFRDSREDIALVGYFRKDRMDRNIIFEQIFPEIERIFGDQIRKIWFGGYGALHTYRNLPLSYRKFTDYTTDIADIDSMLSSVRENNLVLVTICNRVNPFMDALMEKLGAPVVSRPTESTHLTSLLRMSTGSGMSGRKK